MWSVGANALKNLQLSKYLQYVCATTGCVFRRKRSSPPCERWSGKIVKQMKSNVSACKYLTVQGFHHLLFIIWRNVCRPTQGTTMRTNVSGCVFPICLQATLHYKQTEFCRGGGGGTTAQAHRHTPCSPLCPQLKAKTTPSKEENNRKIPPDDKS